jgi:DNA-binding IclR family transcriptional regulator
MSKIEPSSFGHGPKEQAEHPRRGNRVLGRTAAALEIVSCLDAAVGEAVGDSRRSRDSNEIARLTGLRRQLVRRQLVRLIQLGYVDETAQRRYRLSMNTASQADTR